MDTARLETVDDNVELEYEVTGSGEPVLFISPVLADGFAPLRDEPALADYRLITYHKRGWVGSTHTPPPVTVADHAADAAALLDHLGIGRAHVAGHSSGAAIALELALARPSHVHSLVLLEPSLLSVPSAAKLLGAATPAFEAYADGDHESAVAGFLSVVSGLDWARCRAVLDDRIPGAVESAVQDADTFFGVELPALGDWAFAAARAAGVTQPALSVVGADTEPLWVEVAERLSAWMPDVDECTIDGAGHLLHLQQPAAVAAAIGAFLRRHPMEDARSSRRPLAGRST